MLEEVFGYRKKESLREQEALYDSSPKFRETVIDKPQTIYEVLDILRDDQQRFDKTVADLRTQKTALPQTKCDDDK